MLNRIRDLVGVVWREAAKFGIVGAICLVIDLGGFNLLVDGPLEGKVTTAKIVSGLIATAVAWIGNRWWTFRHRQNRPVSHEVTMFFVVNGIALALSSLWLAFTHYALGMDSRLATNLNAFIGIGIGTLFRFWAYRKVVFSGEHPGDQDAAEAVVEPFTEPEPEPDPEPAPGSEAGTDPHPAHPRTR
ncbi:GtrA family protein [Dermacoccaceae bacterium W4C1]